MSEDRSEPAQSGVDGIACTLTESESSRRRELVEADLIPHVEAISVDSGEVEMTVAEEALDALVGFVEREHECCSFATFDLRVTPAEQPNELVLRADRAEVMFEEGMREMIEETKPELLT